MKSIYMFSMYLQSWVPRHFLLLWFEHRTILFSWLCMSILTSNSSGSMQNHGYLGCFHAASARENIFGVWGIWQEMLKISILVTDFRLLWTPSPRVQWGNTLWSRDNIWWHNSWSTLAQLWRVASWHQAIRWTDVDLSSARSLDINLRVFIIVRSEDHNQ